MTSDALREAIDVAQDKALKLAERLANAHSLETRLTIALREATFLGAVTAGLTYLTDAEKASLRATIADEFSAQVCKLHSSGSG